VHARNVLGEVDVTLNVDIVDDFASWVGARGAAVGRGAIDERLRGLLPVAGRRVRRGRQRRLFRAPLTRPAAPLYGSRSSG
jgi:hypothetical protein